jgi:hypothetical protein
MESNIEAVTDRQRDGLQSIFQHSAGCGMTRICSASDAGVPDHGGTRAALVSMGPVHVLLGCRVAGFRV